MLMTVAATTPATWVSRQRRNGVANVIAARTAEYVTISVIAIRREVASTGWALQVEDMEHPWSLYVNAHDVFVRNRAVENAVRPVQHQPLVGDVEPAPAEDQEDREADAEQEQESLRSIGAQVPCSRPVAVSIPGLSPDGAFSLWPVGGLRERYWARGRNRAR